MNPQIHADNVKLMQDWPINRGIVETSSFGYRYGHVVGYRSTPYIIESELQLIVKFSDIDGVEYVNPKDSGFSYTTI